jgi:tetratricopeptide (TPR) repeat protein
LFTTLPLADGPLPSTDAVLKVKPIKDLSPEEKGRMEVDRAMAEARIAFAAEKYADAEKIARDVITKKPDSFEAHLILARSLSKQDKLREAYDEFGSALDLRRPTAGRVNEPPYAIIFEMQRIAAKLGIKPEPPDIDEAFIRHDLSATGQAVPPFSKSTEALLFKWELSPQTGPGPLGIRWIAEDVPGVEKNRVIATSKSETDKREGEFTLKKPTAGFPPGQYRVELWQAGKMIYSEKFEIKSE